MNKITLGSRYYNWTSDDELNEIKIIKLLGDDNCRCKYTLGPNTGKVEDITVSHIKDNYTLLNPDGYITFNIAIMGESNIKDVIVFLNKSKDMEMGDTIPYCVCRQSVNDLFTATTSAQTGKSYYGISVSKDTCPADVQYENYLACNGVEKFVIVAVYIGDKLQDILNLFKHKDFDTVLYNLFVSRCKYVSDNIKFIINKNMQKRYINGYCKNLSDLLQINNFEYDLYRAFDILPLNVDLSGCENEEFPIAQLETLKCSIRRNIDKSIVIKYDKSIDLSKIERKYTLVADSNKDVYIVAYTDTGIYQVPTNGNLLDIDSIEMAYKNVAINTAKYTE